MVYPSFKFFYLSLFRHICNLSLTIVLQKLHIGAVNFFVNKINFEGVGIGVVVGLDNAEVGIDWKFEVGGAFAKQHKLRGTWERGSPGSWPQGIYSCIRTSHGNFVAAALLTCKSRTISYVLEIPIISNST